MTRRGIALGLPAVLAASLLAVLAQPEAAVAAGGPSVPLPEIASTPVERQTMSPRPPDQASQSALSGNQPSGGSVPEGGGTSSATPLSPSATWDVSEQTGDFTWSYPLRVPPAPGGLEPELALSYTSSAVDGRTSATNNQPSWVGEGWELSPGFIERTYQSCLDDTMGGTTPPKVGDLCWRSDNAVATYNGGGGMLIRDDATGQWRARSDDGSRIERLTGAGNGDNNGEYWKITTVDGTQYFFGSRPESKSTWTVPVFGDDVDEPCHGSSFDTSHCMQAWRWNLDKVVDRHGNMMIYTYETETNSYGMNLKDKAVSYVRGGTLRRIEYGLRDGQQATGRVEFTVADRCVPGSTCTPDRKENWPDVPWDAKCDTSTCADRYSPSFWSTKRLAKITTQVRRGTGFTDVDSWTLNQQFPDPGDGEKAVLWLQSITHTGHVGDETVSLPAVTFEGTKLPNRVFKVDGVAPLNRYRLTGVVSEAGGVLTVTYAEPDCIEGASMPTNPHTNTLRCFPVTWNKKDHAERTDYFHKYVVDHVTQSDRIGANTEQVTSYQYLGGAAWHYDTSEFTKDDKRTWNEFRGFGRVQIRTGKPDDPSGPIGKTEQRFYRGMHGDKLPSGTRTVTVSATEGNPRVDEDWLQGFPLETITYDGDTDRVISKVINTPTWQGPTATRGRYKAYIVRTGAEQAYTALAAGGWRTTRVESTYDDRGLLVRTNDLGDTSTAADDQCTRTTYVRNTSRWLLTFPSREETVAVACGATPIFPQDAISDTRYAYDGQAPGAAPTTGIVTRAEQAEERPASGPVYITVATAKYDAHGRVVESADALGRVTKTSYTPSVGGPTTQSAVTNPLGHTTTTTFEPAWGAEILVVDANNRQIEREHDPLGRTVSVWSANRPRPTYQDHPNVKYAYRIRNDGPSVVTTSAIGPNGNYVTSKELYDGLLRLRQTQQPATGGGRLLTDVRYDSQGRAYKATQPYFHDAAVDDNLWVASDVDVPGLMFTEYDGAGRKVAEIYKAGGKEKWRTTTAYGGDRVHLTPPAGGTAATTISDARGQTVELRQYHGGTPSGTYDAVTYTYTKAGQLDSTTDPAGNIWRFAYDLRGNQIRVEDPDKGISTMTYDAAGQLLASTDARGVALTYDYDDLGRKTVVRAGSTTMAEWTYDTAIRGKGMLASAKRYVDGAAYTHTIASYTALYDPSELSVSIPKTEQTLAGTYTTHASFNPDGSPKGETLPKVGDLAEETVNWSYDDLANPLTLSGGPNGGPTVNYVTNTQYTRYGEVARVQLGEIGKRVWQSHYYESSTRRLNRTIVDAELSQPMQSDVNYRYDPFGNVTSVADRPQEQVADVQCFRYDYLRRLTEAWTPATECGSAPSIAELGGPASYWHSFTYDSVGNRLTETQHAASGDTVRTYAYPSSGAHKLSSITTTGLAGTSTDEYRYDATGNTIARDLATGAQELTWDAEGKLTKVVEDGKTTEFVYDADGNRLIRRDPTGTTLYLDGQELRLDKATGKLTGTRYYQHGDGTVAIRTAAGLTWLAGDHQDTAQIAVDSVSQQVIKRRQLPFGVPRGGEVAFPGEKGFVGGTIDASTGLTNLGARQYDPLLGRFISVDPIMDLADAQQMHGYTYSNNNPITHADPTGMLWGWLEDTLTWAGIAAAAVAMVTPPGWIAATAAAVGFVAGAVLAGDACTGGGSVADCAIGAVGALPVYGKVVGGIAKLMHREARFARARIADGFSRAGRGAVNLIPKVRVPGRSAYRAARVKRNRELADEVDGFKKWLGHPVLGKHYELVSNIIGAAGITWSFCLLGREKNPGSICDLPKIQPPGQPHTSIQKPPRPPANGNHQNRRPDTVGTRPGGPILGPAIPTRATPATNSRRWSSGTRYETPDGRFCDRRGGPCAF